MLTALRVN